LKKIILMFRKITFFLILFLIFCATKIQAQNNDNKIIDSLKTALKEAKSISQKTKLLISLSAYSEYIGSDNAIKYAKLGLSYAKKLKDSEQIGSAYTYIGSAYEIKSDYPHALTNFYNALEIYEKTNDTESLSDLYNNMGLIYIDLKNYKQGIFFYNKALNLCYKSKKEKNVGLLLNNIGDVYLQKKEYLKALNYFYRSLIINKKLDETSLIALNYTNIGLSYINTKKYEKGLEMLQKSAETYGPDLNLYKAYNDYELGRAYYLMSEEKKYEADKKDLIKKSITYLENSLQEFKKYNSLKDIQENYFYLYKAYKLRGDTTHALNSFERHSTIKDSIFSEDSKKKLANLEFEREIDIKDKQIEIQALKIKSDARKVYLLIAIATAVALLLGLFLFLYISKKRTNQLLKEKNLLISDINKQKDKFNSIIAHDLRSPFNGFLGLTELMADEIDLLSPEEIKFAASNMRTSAKNLFDLLENLLEWSRMEQNLIPFEPEEHSLEGIISESIITLLDNAEKKEISINTQIPNSLSVFADKNMFQAVIRNLVSNATKFTPKKGTIQIYTSEDSTNITILIKDSGIGMSPKIIEDLFKIDTRNNRIGTDNEQSTGLGLMLCKEFIDKHDGKIWAESEEGMGSTFYVSLPKKLKN
jgi:signal transduction histidine kinase